MDDRAPDNDLRSTFERLGFLTRSPNVLSLLHLARKAAAVSDVTILLEGETGTGKQVLAHGIHQLDQKRSSFPFVTIHCSTISEALAESEFFGHRRGAFSGALADRRGLFQAAQNGTLFLDDVNDLPLHLQPKLLDVIQRGTVRPVGSDREVPVNTRLIAACNQPLEPLVEDGRFRADLYHRLNVVKLKIPPLRQRRADLQALILALACRHAALYSKIEAVDIALLRYLEMQLFPGNVRELENAVQRMLFLKKEGVSFGLSDWIGQECSEYTSRSDPLAEAAQAIWQVINGTGVTYTHALREVERRVLQAAMGVPGSTRRQIAQRLNTSERNLYYKMRIHKLADSAKT